jgi:LysR family transcriptional activator of nhaA
VIFAAFFHAQCGFSGNGVRLVSESRREPRMHDADFPARHGAPNSTAPSGAKAHLLDNLQELNYSHLLYFWAVARDGSIASACQRLHLRQPTISMQIRKLERALGHRLFERSGRNLVLTDVGRTVFDYADEMFSLGRELLGTLRGLPGKRSGRLHVGIPTFLPKLITYQLLKPVLRMQPAVQMICHEAEMSELMNDLARHKFDAILSDRPIQASTGIRCFNHPLVESEIAICGSPALAAEYRQDFPNSLDGAPLLLPSSITEMRRALDRWFDDQNFNPRVLAEFDDSALMKEFGGGGAGLFPVVAAVLPELQQQYGVQLVGHLPNARVRYYAVTTERKLTHPATVVIAQSAKRGMERLRAVSIADGEADSSIAASSLVAN